jgi:hypothetical protein
LINNKTIISEKNLSYKWLKNLENSYQNLKQKISITERETNSREILGEITNKQWNSSQKSLNKSKLINPECNPSIKYDPKWNEDLDVILKSVEKDFLVKERAKKDLVSPELAALNLSSFEEASPLTKHVMTRWYRPPEVILLNNNYDMKVDIWSLGCVFAELLGEIKRIYY